MVDAGRMDVVDRGLAAFAIGELREHLEGLLRAMIL